MTLTEILGPEDNVFVKSEWGPISEEWPALSFTRRSVAKELQQVPRPEKALLIYVGTSDPKFTQDEHHRQRLLSALRIEPGDIVATEDLIPRSVWLESQRQYKGRFLYSFPVVKAWEFEGFPLAKDVIPLAYGNLGTIQHLGKVVKVSDDERQALLRLAVREYALDLQPIVGRIQSRKQFRKLSREENCAVTSLAEEMTDQITGQILRMEQLIAQRAARGGSTSTIRNPERKMNSDLFLLLQGKWHSQGGRCALCMGKLSVDGQNPLLQPSADRANSEDPAYDGTNLQITHLACNLAKNQWSAEQFEQWLEVVREAVCPVYDGSSDNATVRGYGASTSSTTCLDD